MSFAAVDLPIERRDRPLYAARPIEPDVRSNAGAEGRIYLILLDDVHVHPSRVPRVRDALRQFIERNFGTNDLAAVVRVRGGSQDSQDFTNNPRLLLRAIDRFTGNVPREAAVASTVTGGGASAAELEVAHEARNVSSRLRELSEFLAGVRGRRKAMLFVSEGSPFDIHASMGQMGAMASMVIEDTQKAIAAAARGNVTIYPIDPRGLAPMDPNDLSAAEPASGAGARLAQNGLRELATETGGFASINMNNLDGAFTRIVRENSAYYVLGYSPSNDRRDGKFRQVQVRVKRPGLQVRSRNGYAAPSGRAPTQVRSTPGETNAAIASALASPLPTSGVPLTVFAAPYRGNAGMATIALAIEVDASKFQFVEKNGIFTERLEVVQTAIDSKGKTRPSLRHSVALALKPGTFEMVKTGGIRVLSEMDLAPGRYQLRVAAGNATDLAGGVVYDLDVPDFAKDSLVMSGLSLTSSSASQAMTIVPRQASRVSLSTPIVTTREFKSGDKLGIFGEVYENLRSLQAHTVDIVTELRTDTGSVVRKTTESRSSTELGGLTGGYVFTADITLADLTPGVYVIHSEAHANIGDRPTTSRDIQISVR